MKVSRLAIIARLEEQQRKHRARFEKQRAANFIANKAEALRSVQRMEKDIEHMKQNVRRYKRLSVAKTIEEYDKIQGYGTTKYHDPFAESLSLLRLSTDENVSLNVNLKHLLNLGG